MAAGRTRNTLLFTALTGAMFAVFAYLIVRTSLFFLADYHWYEKVLALILLLAEMFTMLHALGYFLNIRHVLRREGKPFISPDNVPELKSHPSVAIVVSSYHEPLEVIEDTLICFRNLTYPNKHIYFLDDTRYDRGGDAEQMAAYRKDVDDLCKDIGVNLFRRRWRGAKAGMINDFLAYLDGNPPEGFEFVSFEEGPVVRGEEAEKYIVVFDADQNPLPDFAEPLIAFMEDKPELAFIQTPQYYTNFETNRVARGAGLQQAVFYEYISEGKSLQDAMFCCGTNVIFRRAALMDVGGFDESSVTEDFATSLKFHEKGWRSAYLNKVCAFGMGPEDLGGYFRQQFRWALGTVGLFRQIVGKFVRNPGMLPPAKWWEYMLSGTHYFVGWVLFAMLICPAAYLYANVPSYFVRPEIYFLFFFPYIMLTVMLFIYTMSQRKYGLKDLALGILLQAITFPVYMRASLLGLLGVRGTFGITPKGGANSLPLRGLWPQLLMALLCVGAVVWGGMRLYYERSVPLAVLTNSFWCAYHFLVLCSVFYFNYPVEKRS